MKNELFQWCAEIHVFGTHVYEMQKVQNRRVFMTNTSRPPLTPPLGRVHPPRPSNIRDPSFTYINKFWADVHRTV